MRLPRGLRSEGSAKLPLGLRFSGSRHSSLSLGTEKLARALLVPETEIWISEFGQEKLPRALRVPCGGSRRSVEPSGIAKLPLALLLPRAQDGLSTSGTEKLARALLGAPGIRRDSLSPSAKLPRALLLPPKSEYLLGCSESTPLDMEMLALLLPVTDKRFVSDPCGTAMLFRGLLFVTRTGTLPLPVPEAMLALLLRGWLSLISVLAATVAAAALAMLLFRDDRVCDLCGEDAALLDALRLLEDVLRASILPSHVRTHSSTYLKLKIQLFMHVRVVSTDDTVNFLQIPTTLPIVFKSSLSATLKVNQKTEINPIFESIRQSFDRWNLDRIYNIVRSFDSFIRSKHATNLNEFNQNYLILFHSDH